MPLCYYRQMPISKDEFRSITDDQASLADRSPDTTHSAVYCFLLNHPEKAFRQDEIANAVTVPDGSVSPTLKRLEEHALVNHRNRFWTLATDVHGQHD